MSKIFGIGLARTGNASLCKALKILGYSCIHFPRSIQEIEQHDTAVDTTLAVGYKFLDLMYPGSKFILTDREASAWLGSCRNYWATHDQKKEEIVMKVHMALYRTLDFNNSMFFYTYCSHKPEVIKHFHGREQDLLVFNAGAGDGWEKLCRFLGKPEPDCNYPHEHKEEYER